MRKTAIMTLTIILTLVAIVGVSFAAWLGNVEQSKDFVLSVTDDYLFVKSSDITITSENNTFTPGKKLTYSFDLKVKGVDADIAFSAINLQYNGGAKGAFIPITDGIIKITPPVNRPKVVSNGAEIILPCTVTVEFIGSVDTVDRHFAGKEFKFTILVTASKSTTVVE